jgi:hypothetical protein
MSAAMVTLHETQVDGVRCFWVETGRPTLVAYLMFRHGFVDEHLTEHGWQHLLEHMALDGRGRGALSINGSVGLLETVFHSHGPADQVSAHLGGITDWLAAPRLDDLDRERRVLQAEAALRGASAGTRALGWRYGAQGPGVAVYDDAGLGRATPDHLLDRAARVFTAGNAVLVLDGPPPPGLRLGLPPGSLLAVPQAVPCETRFPALYVDEGGLVVSGTVQRSAAMVLGSHLLGKELADLLRHQDGNAYAPGATYERIDAETAIVIGTSDVRPDAHSTLLGRTLALMRRLRTMPPDAADLADAQAAQVQSVTDPYALFGVALNAGIETLAGRPVRERDEMVDEIMAVTRADVVAGFEAMHRTLLVGVPGATTYNNEIPRLEAPTNHPKVPGRTWRSVNWPGDRSRLRISTDAVELVDGDVARTIRDHEIHAMLAHDNGLRHLVTADGYGITVNPHAWHRGKKAVNKLDELVPEDRQLPQPALDGIDRVRASFWRRWSDPLLGRFRAVGIWMMLLVVVSLILWVGGTALFVYGEIYALAGLWGFFGGAWMYGLLFGTDDD